MRNLRIADPDSGERTHSPLANCLIHLNTETDLPPAQPSRLQPADWKEKWSASNGQISEKLALIEAELDRLAAVGPEQPLLSVFDSEAESY